MVNCQEDKGMSNIHVSIATVADPLRSLRLSEDLAEALTLVFDNLLLRFIAAFWVVNCFQFSNYLWSLTTFSTITTRSFLL